MIRINIELVKLLLISLKSKSLIKPYSTTELNLETSRFVKIEKVEIIKTIPTSSLAKHHAVCLSFRKHHPHYFTCIYLIDILNYKVVAIYPLKEYYDDFLIVKTDNEYIKLYDCMNPWKERYLLTIRNICNVYLLQFITRD